MGATSVEAVYVVHSHSTAHFDPCPHAPQHSQLLHVCAGLNVSSLLDPTSLAWIQTEDSGNPWSYQTALMSSADISLGFVNSEDTLFAWATSNSDGQPVAGVEITVYRHNWQVSFLLVPCDTETGKALC